MSVVYVIKKHNLGDVVKVLDRLARDELINKDGYKTEKFVTITIDDQDDEQ